MLTRWRPRHLPCGRVSVGWALLAALPVLIVFLIFQSQLTKGMTLRAVK